MSSSIFEKPKKKDDRSIEESSVKYSSSSSFNPGAIGYDNYKIDGKKGQVLFSWDAARRRSPQTSMRLGLDDVKDLVERGFYVWLINPYTRITTRNVDEFIYKKYQESK